MNTEQLIVSVGIILLAARLFGWIFQYIGQPRVVGEMTAGFVLGPSLLGRLFPGALEHVFPPSSMPTLTALSQLGLLLFMFVVGLEVDLKRVLKQPVESLTLVLLLPLFFALTGLRTRIDLLTGTQLWGYTIGIIAVATVGKFAGATLASRITGMAWKESIALGILMNTRGLVELVVLNAGLELGILSSTLFTMMTIMALVTTFMTTPVLSAMKVISEVKRTDHSLGAQ